MLRLNPDGSTDSSFGDDGWFETDTATYAPTALHTLPDGKMLLAGVTYYPTYPTPAIISRLNTDGSPDTAFGSGDGSTEVNIEAFHDLDRILIQEDDKILLVGSTATGTRSGSAHELPDPDVWRVSIARLTPDGDLDTSFSTDGLLRLSDLAADFVLDARLLPDDDILLLASEDSPSGDDADGVLLIRLNPDGSVQSTTAPAVSNDDVRNALFYPDGNALVFTASETLRFTNDGEYDPTFSADPIRAFDRFVFDDEERLITLSDTRAGLRAARHLLT